MEKRIYLNFKKIDEYEKEYIGEDKEASKKEFEISNPYLFISINNLTSNKRY